LALTKKHPPGARRKRIQRLVAESFRSRDWAACIIDTASLRSLCYFTQQNLSFDYGDVFTMGVPDPHEHRRAMASCTERRQFVFGVNLLFPIGKFDCRRSAIRLYTRNRGGALDRLSAEKGALSPPRLRFGEVQVYPPIAKAARITGAVVLREIITKTGSLKDLRVGALESADAASRIGCL
jgi:hypothetical protein